MRELGREPSTPEASRVGPAQLAVELRTLNPAAGRARPAAYGPAVPELPAGADRGPAQDHHDPLHAHPLVAGARRLAGELLGELGDRWRHSEAVADRAATAAPAVEAGDRPVLVAAAWLHDIGYAPILRRSGFHPLDGAWHLYDDH